MARSATDWRPLLAQIIQDVLVYIVHSTDRKPADTRATDALARLDALRLALLADAGEKEEPLSDPHGMVVAQPVKAEGKT